MKKQSHVRKVLFFALALAALLCLSITALAEETNPCAVKHVGPYEYRNTVNATCIVDGHHDKYCLTCGQFVVTEPIIAQGHQYEKHTTQIFAPTCLEEGLNQIIEVCRVCGITGTVENQSVPALGHDWGSWQVTKAPTCEGEGEKTCICKRDSTHVKKETLAAIGHDYGEWKVTKAPTCEEEGVETSVCKNDSSHTKTQSVPAIGHNWDGGTVTKEPNCTYPGVRTYICKNDSSHKYTAEIPIVPSAHDYDKGKVVKAPTCASKGIRRYTCQINDTHTYDVEIPIDPDAHDWGPRQVIVPADCETEGLARYVCKNDSSHVKDEKIPASGHNWDEGTIIKKSTLTEEGEKLYVCKNNPSHTKIEKLPVITMRNNTLCAFGPRLYDKDVNLYDQWYMFTPFDASKDGRQTFELVATNYYIVGSVTLDIRNGKLTIDYKINGRTLDVTLEFFTVLSSLDDLKNKFEPEELTRLALKRNQPIDLQETFGDDRNLVLYFCSRCNYTYSERFTGLNYNSKAHQQLRKDMMKLWQADEL